MEGENSKCVASHFADLASTLLPHSQFQRGFCFFKLGKSIRLVFIRARKRYECCAEDDL